MIYKAFAAATLIIAPLMVIAVQNFTPHPHHEAPAPPVAAQVPPAIQPAAAPAFSSAPVLAPDPASFGQPTAGAGQPVVITGGGLPAHVRSAARAPALNLSEPGR